MSPHLTLLLLTADMAENEKQNQLEELMYQRSKLKKKMLGNINFIGELFNLGMLSSKIIISQVCWNMCFNLQLLRNCDSTIICGYLIRISSILTANEFLFLALLLFNLPIFFSPKQSY